MKVSDKERSPRESKTKSEKKTTDKYQSLFFSFYIFCSKNWNKLMRINEVHFIDKKKFAVYN